MNTNEKALRPFNPSEHVIQLKSREGAKDYLPVQWRLVWFREQYPAGTIDTEELEVDLDREVEEEAFVWNNEKRRSEKIVKRAKGYARFRAVVTDGNGGRATGTKTENAASFPDYVEKAETGAIGRALAALGYGTQFAPDLDEAHRLVDSPVERSTVNNLPAASKPVSPRPPAGQQGPAAKTEEVPAKAVSSDHLNTLYGAGKAKRLFKDLAGMAKYAAETLDLKTVVLTELTEDEAIQLDYAIAATSMVAQPA